MSPEQWQEAMAAFRAEQASLKSYFQTRADIRETRRAINFFLKPYSAKYEADSEVLNLKQQAGKIRESLTGKKSAFFEASKTDKVKGTETSVADAVAKLQTHIQDLGKQNKAALQSLEKSISG